MGVGLAVLNRIGGAPVIDRLGLRKPVERTVFHATRAGFRTAGVAGRTFSSAKRRRSPQPAETTVRPEHTTRSKLFDLTPTDEQRMIADATRDFATKELRPKAAAADEACAAPDGLLERAAAELGVQVIGVPTDLGGVAGERSAVTNLLVAEALAHGDMGLAVAILAPSAVVQSLVLWGDAEQQASYLPPFVTDAPPAASLAVLEPTPLFDAFRPGTTARRDGADWVLSGTKSLVPLAGRAELFLVAATVADGSGPALFLLESDTEGLTVESEPAMGLRAAGMGRLLLGEVRVPGTAVLGGLDNPDRAARYAECVRLSRLAWAALATGTGQAVLDYVIPYVNERKAFGEPISNRQAVAFSVADIGIELEGLRLMTKRAAARVDQGLPYARDVALARTLAAEYGMKIGSDGVQLLGGHGFVKEHPVERWYRDLRAVGIMEGAVLL